MRPLQKEGTIANYFMNNNGGLIASGQFLISKSPFRMAEGARI